MSAYVTNKKQTCTRYGGGYEKKKCEYTMQQMTIMRWANDFHNIEYKRRM
jgi:hypothetical protein